LKTIVSFNAHTFAIHLLALNLYCFRLTCMCWLLDISITTPFKSYEFRLTHNASHLW